MNQASLWTPAKVNLVLYVKGRRPDGYHLLESLVVPVSLYDRLRVVFLPTKGGSSPVEIFTRGIPVPTGDSNIIVRAVRAYSSLVGRPLPRMRIYLEKYIPVGAGLGGGSSDAAAVLWLLQRMLGNPLETSELLKLAANLGSDVPFFLHEGAAVIRGVGNEVERVSLPSRLHLVLCSDGTALLTSEVYREARHSLTAFTRVSNIRPFLEGRISLAEALQNDLEASASALHLGISNMKAEMLSAGASAALMTGSGSCVFGVCSSWIHARQVAQCLTARGYWAVPVQTLPKTWALC